MSVFQRMKQGYQFDGKRNNGYEKKAYQEIKDKTYQG